MWMCCGDKVIFVPVNALSLTDKDKDRFRSDFFRVHKDKVIITGDELDYDLPPALFSRAV